MLRHLLFLGAFLGFASGTAVLPGAWGTESGGILELTGNSSKIIFGPAENPFCELMLQQTASGDHRIVSTCPIEQSSSSSRRQLREDSDQAFVSVAEHAALKDEVAALRRTLQRLEAGN